LATVDLRMPASRTGEAGRRVTPGTELIGIRIFLPAFTALHDGDSALAFIISIGKGGLELEARISISGVERI